MTSTSWRRAAGRTLAVAAALGSAAAADATVSVYASQSAFLAAVTASAVDDFDNLPAGTAPSPAIRMAGGYAYRAAVETDPSFYGAGSPVPPGLIYGAGSAADRWLSTNAATDTVRFSDLGGVRAIGGLFFGSDVDGLFLPGSSIQLLAADSGGSTAQLLANATTGSFVGFVSDRALVSLSVVAVQPSGGNVWSSVNNLVLASPVPEPQSWVAMLAGLGWLGALGQRRRSAARRQAAPAPAPALG